MYTNPNLTWVLGQSPTGAQLTQYLSAQLASMRAINDYSCKLYRTSNQSFGTSGARTAISWTTAAWNTGSMWVVGSPTRITAPIDGYYYLASNAQWASNTSGSRAVGWRRGSATGVNFDNQVQDFNDLHVCTGCELLYLAAGDYIEVFGMQSSGGALNLLGGTEQNSWASLRLLGSGSDDPPPWVSPRTWASGESVSPALFNTHLRDNIRTSRFLKGAACSLYLSEDLSVESERREPVTWGEQLWGIGGMWTGGSEIVAPVPGIYQVTANIEWSADARIDGVRGVGYMINGSNTKHDLKFQPGVQKSVNNSATDWVRLRVGDRLEIYVWQDTDESLSLHGDGEDRTRVQVHLAAAPG